MKSSAKDAFTWVEILVCLVVIGVLGFLAIPKISNTDPRQHSLQKNLNNMRQLHIATQIAAMDRATTTNTNVGWPGDVGGTFSNWTTMLIDEDYLQATDLSHLLSAPGIVIRPENIPLTNTTAILVYNVSSETPNNTVFLTSANFTHSAKGGTSPSRWSKPLGNKAFVVVRKSGEGRIFKSSQAGDTHEIGGFVPLLK